MVWGLWMYGLDGLYSISRDDLNEYSGLDLRGKIGI